MPARPPHLNITGYFRVVKMDIDVRVFEDFIVPVRFHVNIRDGSPCLEIKVAETSAEYVLGEGINPQAANQDYHVHVTPREGIVLAGGEFCIKPFSLMLSGGVLRGSCNRYPLGFVLGADNQDGYNPDKGLAGLEVEIYASRTGAGMPTRPGYYFVGIPKFMEEMQSIRSSGQDKG